MRVLWLVNILLPEASILLNQTPTPYGGWLDRTSQSLSKEENFELSVAAPINEIKTFSAKRGVNIDYYYFRTIKDNNTKQIINSDAFNDIVKEVKPDIVHIFGTELAHTLAMVNVCNRNSIKTVISIQGLVSIIEKHIFANLPLKAIYGFTFRNLLRQDNVIGLKRVFNRRGKNEIEAIRKVDNIIGRTTWDKACTSQMNSKARYYFCNETLRDSFYNYKWNFNECEKYSIFLSQGHYPIKGLHYVLEAMPTIIKKYPNVKLYISGKDITKTDTLKDRLSMTYYGKYIIKTIDRLKIEDNVMFTGPLNEKEMCAQFLKSHVFVSPSVIENSPNSLGEAMILGVPCVASYVGGTPDMLSHNEEGFLYQADAPYMLAYYICEIFGSERLAITLSEKARIKALNIYDGEENLKKLTDIYQEIKKLDSPILCSTL